MPRLPRKRGGSPLRGLSHEQVCVLTAIDANNKLFATKIGQGNPTIESLSHAINSKIDNSCLVIADCKSHYESIFKNKNYELIQLKAGIYTFNEYNLANVNSLHGELKNFLRIFHGVASKYLEGYLDWFCYRKFIRYKSNMKYHVIEPLNHVINAKLMVVRRNIPSS